MKKAQRPPAPPEAIPPVRESVMEVAEKRKSQLMEERKRRGMQATLMMATPPNDKLGY